MKMDVTENRKDVRYSLHVPAVINHLDGETSPVLVETLDVSAGGVFINSVDLSLCEGCQVQVELTLTVDKLKELFEVSNKVLLKATGTVTRTSDKGIAVKFSNKYSISPVPLNQVD